eukprot:TRINITY_DN12310_c0_g1_i1.p1 TRINITY_DN12310_c0_g1~~TRINITY_DN12310_c0_g1_i1.p1  ORF type:complete len:1025 (+),score=135.03 TRINITY_DN12310_c0_g1_i1:92-3166(+)
MTGARRTSATATRGCAAAQAFSIVAFRAATVLGAPPVLSVDENGNRVFKVAMLALNPPTDFTWSYRHHLGRSDMIDKLLDKYADMRVESEYEILPEGDSRIPGVFNKWGRNGQNLVIATSFGYQDMTVEAARRWPATNWIHLAGYETATPNFAAAWCRVFQSRYLTGIAAASVSDSGKIGYVAAFPNVPEVVRGFNSFTIGVRKYNPAAKVFVNFMMGWSNYNRTALASTWLHDLGCDVIAGHTNDRSLYDPFINNGLLAVGYYANMRDQYGDRVVMSAFFDWGPMYTRFAEDTLAGRPLSSAFDGMLEGVPVVSTASQYIGRRGRDMIDAEKSRLLRGDDLHPVHRGSAMIFCGPLNDEYGMPILANSSDCADLDSHPRPAFQERGGGLLNMQWYVEGIEDLGVVTLPRDSCPAGRKYTWIKEGRRVMDNSRHQLGPSAPGREKLRQYFLCEPCLAGEFSSEAGRTHCELCPAGTASPGSSDTHNASHCLVCPEGTFSGVGAADCSPCPPGSINFGQGNTECPISASDNSWVSRYWWVILIVAVAAVLILGLPALYKYTEQRRAMMQLYSNNAVAENCAISIAEMRLEDLDYINDIPNPNRIQQAFIMIVAHLKEYRSFLPQAILRRAGDSEMDIDESAPSLLSNDTSIARLPTPLFDDHASDRESEASPGCALDRQASMNSAPGVKSTRSVMTKAAEHMRRSATLLVGNVLNTYSCASKTVLRHWLSDLVDVVDEVVSSTRGNFDGVVGDRVRCSWNAVRYVPAHRPAGALAAAKLTAVQPAAMSLAVCAGEAYCGHQGSAVQRYHAIVGPMCSFAHAVERYAAWMGPAGLALCEHSVRADQPLVYFRWHSVVSYLKRERAPVSLWAVVGVAAFQQQTAQQEWMYALRDVERADPYTIYNAAAAALASGADHRARELLLGIDPDSIQQAHATALLLQLDAADRGGVHPATPRRLSDVGIDNTVAPSPRSRASESSPRAATRVEFVAYHATSTVLHSSPSSHATSVEAHEQLNCVPFEVDDPQ